MGHGQHRQAGLAAKGMYLLCEPLRAQPHRVGHVRRGLDHHVPLGAVALCEKLVVKDHLFRELRELPVAHICEFKDVAARHLVLIKSKLSCAAHLHPVERAAHFVIDDGGAGRDAVDDALFDQLGDEGRYALMQVRAASGDDRHLAAAFFSGDDPLCGGVERLLRTFVEPSVEFLYQFTVDIHKQSSSRVIIRCSRSKAPALRRVSPAASILL